MREMGFLMALFAFGCASRAPVPITRIAPEAIQGGEDIAIGPDGSLYTGTQSGEIVAIRPNGQPHRIFSTGGRPLGMRWFGGSSLVVADGRRGLMRVSPSGENAVLVPNTADRPLLCNGVAVAPSGHEVYFTSSSANYPLGKIAGGAMVDDRSGALYRYDTRTRQATRVLENLSFPNGVAVLRDGSVVIAETFACRLLRWDPQEGRAEAAVLADGLPGYPDNLSVDEEGRLYIALCGSRQPVLDLLRLVPLSGYPLVPLFGDSHPMSEVARYAVYESGRMSVHELGEGPEAYAPLTSVVRHGDKLYFASVGQAGIGMLKAADQPPAGETAK